MKKSETMHLMPEKHPFSKNGKAPKPATAKSAATGPTAASRKGLISANSSMKK